MSRGNNAPWTDFDQAWKSVEELKEELERTERKLQNAARTFTWDYPQQVRRPDVSRATSATNHFKNGSVSRPQTVPSASQTTRLRVQESNIENKVPSGSIERLHEERPQLFRPQGIAVSEKQELVRAALGRIVSKLSTDGSSVSTIHHDIKNGNTLPSAVYCHEWLNTLGTDNSKSNKRVVATSSTLLDTGKSPRVSFTAWDRQFLSRELPDFEFSESQPESIEPQPPIVTKMNNPVQRTTFVFQKSNFLSQTLGPTQALPVKVQSLGGLHKLKEIVERQRERSNADVIDIETDTVDESSSSCGERKPVETFIPKTKLVDVAIGTDSLITAEDEGDGQKTLPLRKVSVAPPPPEYKGFSPVKALPPEVPFKIEMSKVGVSRRKITPKVAKRTRTSTTKPKEVITPFSWREGQRLANEHLGPPPQVIFKSIRDLPREKDSDTESHSNTEPMDDSTLAKTSEISPTLATDSKTAEGGENNTIDLTESPERESKAAKTDNKENTSPDPVDAAREILNFMAENESDVEISDEDEMHNVPVLKPPYQIPINKKRKAGKLPGPRPPPPKLRHYDREKVLEYIEKQKSQRKKKLHEEQLKKIQAEQAKKERLQKLYDYQKVAAKTVVKTKPIQPLKVVHDNIKIVKRVESLPFAISTEFIATQISSFPESKSLNKSPRKSEKILSDKSSMSLNITRTIETPSFSADVLSAVKHPVSDVVDSSGDKATSQIVSSASYTMSEESPRKFTSKDSNRTPTEHSTQSANKLKKSLDKIVDNAASERHKVSDTVSEKLKTDKNIPEKSNKNAHEKHKPSENVSEKHKTSGNVSEKHKTNENISEKHKTSENVSEKQKTSKSNRENCKTSEIVSEKHIASGNVAEKSKSDVIVSEKQKTGESIHEKYKTSENVRETRKESVSILDSNSLIEDSLSGISSLHTASVAVSLMLKPSDMLGQTAVSSVPVLKQRDLALSLSLEANEDPKVQRVHEFVQQQNVTEITMPSLPNNDTVESESSDLPVKNDNVDGDSYASFRERISRIGSMEDIKKFLNSSRKMTPQTSLDETKSSTFTGSDSSSHESFFTKRNSLISKEPHVLASQSSVKEWKFPWSSTVPDPHNIINTWKRKPLVFPTLVDTNEVDDAESIGSDKKVELITETVPSVSSVSKPLEEIQSYGSFVTERTVSDSESGVKKFSSQFDIDKFSSKSESDVNKFSSKSENTVDKLSLSQSRSILSKTSSSSKSKDSDTLLNTRSIVDKSSSTHSDSIGSKPLSTHSKNTISKPSDLESIVSKPSSEHLKSIRSKSSLDSTVSKPSSRNTVSKPSLQSTIGKPSSKLESDVEKLTSAPSENSEISEVISVEKGSVVSDQRLWGKRSTNGRTPSESSESEIFEGTEITKLSQIRTSNGSASFISSESEAAASSSNEVSEPLETVDPSLHQGIDYTETSESAAAITNSIKTVKSSDHTAASVTIVSSASAVPSINTRSSVNTTDLINTASSASAVPSINTHASVNTTDLVNTVSSASAVPSINTHYSVNNTDLINTVSSTNEDRVLSNSLILTVNASKENTESVEDLSQHSSSNQDESALEEDLENNTKSASQENASEYLTPENLSDEILRTSESPESRFSDAKVENEEKISRVRLAESFLDPTTITRVVTQAATAAATSAVMAVLESQGSFANKKERMDIQAKSMTPSSSSKQEYSSDFENTQGTASEHGSEVQSSKSQTSSNKEIEEDIPIGSASEASEEVKEDLVNEVAPEEDASLSVITVQSVPRQLSHRETISDKHKIDTERSPQKRRKRSENISSPSPASLSENESLASSAISSSQSSEEKAMNAANADSFTQLTLDMLRRMIQDEELRAREKLSYFKSEEKNLVEKFHIEMRWLQSVKKRLREKGYNNKLSLIKEKEEELISRLRQERAQLRSLQETYRSYSQKQTALLLEKKKLFAEPSSPAVQKKEKGVPLFDKTIEKASNSHSVSSISPVDDVIKLMEEDKSQADVPEGVFDSSSSIESVVESQNASASKPSHSSYSKHSKPLQSSSQRTSKLESNFSHSSQQSPFSLESILQGLKRLEASKRFLTKKEQRLVQRRKHVEDLLQWQSSLDYEEKDVKELEHKAVEMLEKSKHRSKYYVSSISSQKNDSPSQETLPASQPPMSSIEGVSSDKEVMSTNSLQTVPPSNGSDSVQEASSLRISSKSDSSSAEKVSDDVQAQSQSSSGSTVKEEKAASNTATEEVTENPEISGSNTTNEILTSKSSPGSASVKEKSASSEADSYSDSFILSNENANSSTPTQHKKLASIKSRLSSSTISRMIGRKNRRHDSSGSDDSFTISHSETASDQSDIEGRIYALTEELRRRKLEAEKLKREQKKRRSEQLKDKELSLKKQLEAYDKYIQDVSQELEIQLKAAKSVDPLNQPTPSVKPQIKQPRVAKSRQLQKQLSASSDSQSDVKSSENESSGILDASLLSKERKPQPPSSSHLAKKLRAIETKDSSSEQVKENLSASSSIPTAETKESSEIHTKDSSSVSSSIPDAISQKSSKAETEETLSKSPSQHEISTAVPDQKELGSTLTVASDNSLPYSLEFSTSEESSLHSSKKGEDRSSENSITDAEEKTSDKKREESFSDQVNESSLEGTEVSEFQESTKNDKFPSIESENFESHSTINEESLEEEEESKSGEGTKICDTPDGCKTPPQKLGAVDKNMVEFSDSFHDKKKSEPVKDALVKLSLPITEAHAKKEALNTAQRKDFLANAIVEDILKKVCEDTKNVTLNLKRSKSVIRKSSEASRKRTATTSSSKLPTSLRDIHEKAAILVSETLTESLFRDAVQTVFKIVNSPSVPPQETDVETKTHKRLVDMSTKDESGVSDNFDSLSTSSEASQQEEADNSQECYPEKKDGFVEKQEWLDDDYVFPKSDLQLQAYDQQLFLRQYPYLYRQIPNKPPPPYTPPSSPLAQKYIYSRKEAYKEPETVNIVQDITERLNDAVEECVDFMLEQKAKGLSLKDMESPPQYTETDETDNVRTHQLVFRCFLFQLTKEAIQKFYTEVRQKPKPWRRNQKLAGKPLLPKNKANFLPKIQDEIQKIMKLKTDNQKVGLWTSMKLGMKKRDFVDTIILNELREEEAEWVNYDDDEFTVKLALTDSIFTMLVDDTINAIKEINSKVFPKETDDT